MTPDNSTRIARELELRPEQVKTTIALLSEGATVPFLARYRKEATGSLDEVQIRCIRDRLDQLEELEKRRRAILESLRERDLLTDELSREIAAAASRSELEDIYLPYRPKRRTRASAAREKGLEPLAELLLAQRRETDPRAAAKDYVNQERGVADVEEALAGARDIVAEQVSEDPEIRARLRALLREDGRIVSKAARGKKDEGAKYRDYFDGREPVRTAPSHRVLALLRGEREGVLSLRVELDEDRALGLLKSRFLRTPSSPAGAEVLAAIEDGYARLLAPSLENETRSFLKDRADREAIAVFAENLRELLLAPPLGQRNVLALDPGFRTGCKVVCLDRQGALLHHDVIYPHSGNRALKQAEETLVRLVRRHQIEAIAIGNGTASRETERFVRGSTLPEAISVVLVNESGASIYSASEVARAEFPEHDVTVRGAVSIGRRLMDPLAELVKLDPKSIGVGQYQHDVDQKHLKQSLDDVVMSCVNGVGVDVNTASPHLLTYVSGLGPQLARNIVAHRDEHGAFRSRAQLKKVSRLGAKAFEQAAGFLRVSGAANPLDASAVHPESYPVVDRIAERLACGVADLIRDPSLRSRIEPADYVTDRVGLPTLEDIIEELGKPGRDPRQRFEVFSFAEGVETLEDLRSGMRLPGIVTNVTAFGAFVDVGVHQDGLVHISQLADRFVRDPSEVVKVQQRVQVTVLEVDPARRRIALSLKKKPSG